jgi:glycosyltransferase involved in cell wall biosynthesis
LRILIASGAGGGTSKGSVGKYYHLKDLQDGLMQIGIECKLIREIDYVVSFPTKHLRRYFSSKKKFQKLISEFKPDAVLVDRQSGFGLEVIKNGIPLFVLLRGHYWSEIQFAKDTIYTNKIMQKIVDIRADIAEQVFAGATVILPICNYLIKIVKEHHPKQETRVFVEGINSSKWYKTKGFELKHPCVGLLQDANWWRKTKEMLTLEKVISDMPNVNFYWVGDGQYKDRVLPILNKYSNFHWLGSLQYPNKVREYLSEIDVYALITGMDLAPLTLKEAQLMERPVIATDVGGNSEMMKDKETGFLVEEGNSKDLFDKLSILIENDEIRREKGIRGRKFVEEKFSINASVKNFVSILEDYVNVGVKK